MKRVTDSELQEFRERLAGAGPELSREESARLVYELSGSRKLIRLALDYMLGKSTKLTWVRLVEALNRGLPKDEKGAEECHLTEQTRS